MLDWLNETFGQAGGGAKEEASPAASPPPPPTAPTTASAAVAPEDESPLVPLPLAPFATAGSTFSALSGGAPDGFRAYFAGHAHLLEAYTRAPNEAGALLFLAEYETLTAGVAYVRHWFFTRHLHMHSKGADFTHEAACFFLLDAVADAARHFHEKHVESDVQNSANAAVQMVAEDLGPHSGESGAKLRATLRTRTLAWLDLIKAQDVRSQLRHMLAGGKAEPLKARTSSFGRNGGGRNTKTDPARGLKPLGYEPLGPIAAGAFSTILRCRAIATGEEVAVKSFDAARCAKDHTFAAQRDNELRVFRMLNKSAAAADGKRESGEAGATGEAGGGGAAMRHHPHISNMLAELGDVDSAHQHCVLEYCAGGSLKRHLQILAKAIPSAASGRSGEGLSKELAMVGGMSPQCVALATRQLASALAHLHGLGVCHSDVKPANILITRAGGGGGAGGGKLDVETLHLKLCDFGFATVCGESLLRGYAGTPAYSPPEIATVADASKGYKGRPTDMWALGCVVYEMLHGKLAFTAANATQLEARVRQCNHAPIHAGVPAPAKSLIKELLERDVSLRLTAARLLEKPWVQEGHLAPPAPAAGGGTTARDGAAGMASARKKGGGATPAIPSIKPAAHPVDVSDGDESPANESASSTPTRKPASPMHSARPASPGTARTGATPRVAQTGNTPRTARGYQAADPIAGRAAERARLGDVSLGASRVAAARSSMATPSLRSARKEQPSSARAQRSASPGSARGRLSSTPRAASPNAASASGASTARATLQRSASASAARSSAGGSRRTPRPAPPLPF